MDPAQAAQGIKKIVTTDMTYGLLVPEQAEQFYVQIFDTLEFSKLHRKEKKRAKAGEIDKLGIGQRLLRAKVEGPEGDDGYRVGANFGRVQYTCVRLKLPWEISEDTIHDNIEDEGFEDKLMGMMTTQLGIDLEDLRWNADTATDPGDPDYDFLKLNDGWLKQITASSHVVDGTAYNGGVISKAHFFAAKRAIPAKYFRAGRMAWMMNESTDDAWKEYVSSRATSAGDAVLLGAAQARPLGYPIVKVPSFADGVVVFADPMNFIDVYTWDVRIRKATEGKSAVMNDMRYYSVFLDDDVIIEEPDAIAIIDGMSIESE